MLCIFWGSEEDVGMSKGEEGERERGEGRCGEGRK